MSDFHPELIWADDEGTTVYAQGYGRDLNVIFSFRQRSENPPTSLANRVCTRFEQSSEPLDPTSTFATLTDMHDAIWAAIHSIWPHCTSHPDLIGSKLDAVVEVDSVDSSTENITWEVVAHPLFPRYLQILAEETSISSGARTEDAVITTVEHTPSAANSEEARVVDFASLRRYEQLGGRGCTTRVRLPAGEEAVFKGIDFQTALFQMDTDGGDGDKLLRSTVRTWRHEVTTLQRLPPHPNILAAPSALVSISWPDPSSPPIICGALWPYHPARSPASRIEESNESGLRLPLELKAHWCADMARAVHHTHRVAETFHMDIKPGNFIADVHGSLILCDWEQIDGPATTLAPEVDGTWDVEEEACSSGGRPHLRYTEYTGPPRRNVEKDILGDAPWHTWNVFPIWSKEHPWALELAEVFALGRSMWMVLRQPTTNFEHIEHPNNMVTDWDTCEDVPSSWKQIVDRCMAREPNERPDLAEVVDFWTTVWDEERTRCSEIPRACGCKPFR